MLVRESASDSLVLKPKSLLEALSWWLSLEGYGIGTAWRREALSFPRQNLLGFRKSWGKFVLYFSQGSLIQELTLSELPSAVSIPPVDPSMVDGLWTRLRWSVSGHYVLVIFLWVAVYLGFIPLVPFLKAHKSEVFLLGLFFLGVTIPLGVRHWALKRLRGSHLRQMIQIECVIIFALQIGILMQLVFRGTSK